MKDKRSKAREYATRRQSIARLGKWLIYMLPGLVVYFLVFQIVGDFGIAIKFGVPAFLLLLVYKVVMEFVNYKRYHMEGSSKQIRIEAPIIRNALPIETRLENTQPKGGDPRTLLSILVEQTNQPLLERQMSAIGAAIDGLVKLGPGCVEQVVAKLGETRNQDLELHLVNVLGRVKDRRADEALREKARNGSKFDPVARSAGAWLVKKNTDQGSLKTRLS